MREVVALTAGRQPELPHDALDERLEATDEFLLCAGIAVLRGIDELVMSQPGAGIPNQ